MMINKGLWHHILTQVGPGGTLLELGSGETSQMFVDYGINVYSIEDDPDWIGKYPGVNYIHAPLVNIADNCKRLGMSLNIDSGPLVYFLGPGQCEPMWYDISKLPNVSGIAGSDTPFIHYDALLLDGPRRRFRPMFHLFWPLFNPGVPWYADDMARPEWYRALLWTAKERNMTTFPEIKGLGPDGHEWCCIPKQRGW
jgi:hypothetical protein